MYIFLCNVFTVHCFFLLCSYFVCCLADLATIKYTYMHIPVIKPANEFCNNVLYSVNNNLKNLQVQLRSTFFSVSVEVVDAYL